jgi:hypothetical protein
VPEIMPATLAAVVISCVKLGGCIPDMILSLTELTAVPSGRWITTTAQMDAGWV